MDGTPELLSCLLYCLVENCFTLLYQQVSSYYFGNVISLCAKDQEDQELAISEVQKVLSKSISNESSCWRELEPTLSLGSKCFSCQYKAVHCHLLLVGIFFQV